jgi:hypothetical protein
MKNLRERPARPRTSRLAPAYPRAIALGAFLLAGCGAVVNNGTTGPTEEPNPAGGEAIPFDFDAGDAAADADADAGGDSRAAKETEAAPPAPPDTEPSPAGNQAYPFDADPLADAATPPKP